MSNEEEKVEGGESTPEATPEETTPAPETTPEGEATPEPGEEGAPEAEGQ